MYKNMDYKDTYCNSNDGNIRYPSYAKESIAGWAYVFTQDIDYVTDLSVHHTVQIRYQNKWIPFFGYLPTRDEIDDFNALPRHNGDFDSD